MYDTETAEITIYRTRLDKELSLRGIAINPEVDSVQTVEILSLPNNPAVASGKETQFLQDTKDTLNQLDLPENVSSKVIKKVVTFTENSPRTFESDENLPRQENLEVFTFETSSNEKADSPKKPSPLVIFSHGGKIGQSVIESSGYLTMLKAANTDINLVAVNHRGSHNHAEKADFNLDTRETDILIALKVAQGNLVRGVNWDGRVILMGDSMGGHVVSTISRKVDVDGVILTEPAAYSVEAQSIYWVYPDSKFPSGDKFQEHLRNDPLFSAKPEHIKTAGIPDSEVRDAGFDPNNISGVLQTHPSNEKSPAFEGISEFVKNNENAKVLLITMDTDTVVPSSVNEGYIDAVKSVNPKAITEVKTPGGHGSTSPQEIQAISEFLK